MYFKMDKKPEHIIVTGDIAWWGKEKDFNEALKWFEKLLKELSLVVVILHFVLEIMILIEIMDIIDVI